MKLTPWYVRIPGIWCVLSLCALVLWLLGLAVWAAPKFRPDVTAGLMLSTVLSFAAWVFARILWVIVGDAFARRRSTKGGGL